MAAKIRGRPPHDDILTPAEWRVFHAAQHGMSKRIIAGRLRVSQDAVKYHLRNIRDKLGVESKHDLAKILLIPKGNNLRDTAARTYRKGSMNTKPDYPYIGQISRTVSDLEQSVNWFEITLELPFLYKFATLAFFDCGGTRLMLTTDGPFNESESILYFRTDDISGRYRSLQEKGVEFINAPHRIHRHEDGTEEWMAFFRDPDGRPLALMSQVKGNT